MGPMGNLLVSRRKNLNIKRKSVLASACAIVGWSFLGNLSTLSVGRIAEKALDLSLASNQSERSFISDRLPYVYIYGCPYLGVSAAQRLDTSTRSVLEMRTQSKK